MDKVIIKKLSDDEVESKHIRKWPVWEKEISRFEWDYDCEEQCYIIEGKFSIETKEGDYNIGPGDFVIFPAGLSCIWDIEIPVKKHYHFS